MSSIPTCEHQHWMNSIQQFVPFLDVEGILRVGGRFDYHGEFTNEMKHPAFLPRRHNVTKLFILDKHERLAHRASETTLAFLINDEGLIQLEACKQCASTFRTVLLASSSERLG